MEVVAVGCQKRVLVRESAWLGDEWVRTWLEAVNALEVVWRNGRGGRVPESSQSAKGWRWLEEGWLSLMRRRWMVTASTLLFQL